MKAILYSIDGKKKGEVNLPGLFEKKIREDIAAKYYEADKFKHPYSPNPEAGKKHSASGTISHKRHDWKGHYGHAYSRIPRMTMWRRGTQFYWIGAEISGTRGGRRAHPPRLIGREKKINKKEIKMAMDSGFAATASEKYMLRRYSSLEKLNLKVPIVIESKINGIKNKKAKNALKEIFGDIFDKIVIKNKKIRSGKGKQRGRKYKANAGLLFVKGKDERIKFNEIDIKNAQEVRIADLYPLGRLTVYTEKALEEIDKLEGQK